MLRLYATIIGIPLLVMASFAALSCGHHPGGCAADEWIAASLVLPGFVLILFPLVALLAFVFVALLLRFRLLRWWQFVLCGATAGALGMLPIYWSELGDQSTRMGYRLSLLVGLIAPAVSLAAVLGLFWLLAVWRNRALETALADGARET